MCVLLLVMCVAASRILDRSRHTLCDDELNVSLVDRPTDEDRLISMDQDIGGHSGALSCAIEIREISPDADREFLKLLFQNRKRSGGDKIEEMYFCNEERRVVITFSTTEGCTAL